MTSRRTWSRLAVTPIGGHLEAACTAGSASRASRLLASRDFVTRRAPVGHDLRHTFASLLIGQGADVVFVSRAMGHADPAIALRVYSHLWAGREHGEQFRQLLGSTLSDAVSGLG
jgi:integrase